jgi:ligand-binding SRPBCC domain-containing protein
MPIIRLETLIQAPPERCFDLARDVDTHVRSTARTRERAVGGVMSGLLGLSDEITWEAVHFRVRQRLTSRITRFERPHRFEDEMVRGVFQSLAHTHEFRPVDGGTQMIDTFRYTAPLGVLGVLADKLFLERHMRRLLTERAAFLKHEAERDRPPVGAVATSAPAPTMWLLEDRAHPHVAKRDRPLISLEP